MAISIKVGLEQRIKGPLPVDSPILPWIVEHAGVVITTGRKGPDGKTPYYRLKDQKFSGKLFEMGEKVLFKELEDQQQLGGWDSRWNEGIWIGYDLATYRSLVHSSGNLHKVNTIKKVPIENRWDAEEIDAIKVKPW